MPYVLKHKTTNQIYTCLLKNHYNLVYYGVKYWEEEDAALSERPAFLAEQGIADADQWAVVPLEENRMKLCNVKTKNNPDLIVSITDEGQIVAGPRPVQT
ncbi:hypothetical protein [Paenibacillus hamazuiensis]|uniref:hypothetical protein n=1 Tax=Paenibacillus hamazuiensis TaxID=2936508 RepID=UPI00200FA131|nr:hypothetical protein [Paenibacillus hamazuiensis]